MNRLVALSLLFTSVLPVAMARDSVSAQPASVTAAKLFSACNRDKLQPGEQISGLCGYWDEHLAYLQSKLDKACSAAGETISKTIDDVEGVAFRYNGGSGRSSYLHKGMAGLAGEFTSPGFQRHYRVFEQVFVGRNGKPVRRTESRVNLARSRGDLVSTDTSSLDAPSLRYLVEAMPLTSPEEQRTGFFGDRTTITDRETGVILAERTVYFYVVKRGLYMQDGVRLEDPDSRRRWTVPSVIKFCDQYQPPLYGFETSHPRSSYEFVSRVLRPRPYTDEERYALYDIALGKERQGSSSCLVTKLGPLITPEILHFSQQKADLVLHFRGHKQRYICGGYFRGGPFDENSLVFHDGTRWSRREILAHAGNAFVDNAAVDLSLRAISEPTPLQEALARNDFVRAKRLILDGVDVKTPIVGDMQIVPILAGKQLIARKRAQMHEVLKAAVLNGADVNALVGGEIHPVLYAAVDGYADTVELLLELGADLDLGNKDVFERILWERPELETIAVLVKHGYAFDRNKPGFWQFVADLAYRMTAKKSSPSLQLYDKLFPDNDAVAAYDSAPIEKAQPVRNQLERIRLFKGGRATQRSGDKSSPARIVLPATEQRDAEGSKRGIEAPKILQREYGANTQLHVIGVYEGGESEPWWKKCQSKDKTAVAECHRRHASAHPEHRIEVHLNGKPKPVVLAFMSYEPAFWVIKNSGNIPIAGVILSGYHGQRVFGVDNQVPIDVFTHEPSNCRSCQVGSGYFYGHESGSKKMRDALGRLRDLTGKSAKSVQGRYRQKTFVVSVK